jgi:glycosyltransferase involved in cell wall biosynthesis
MLSTSQSKFYYASIKKQVIFLTLDATLVGGVERSISTLGKSLIKEGCKVQIYSFFKKYPESRFDYGEAELFFLSNNEYNTDTPLRKLLSLVRILRIAFLVPLSRSTVLVSTFPNIGMFTALRFILAPTQRLISVEHSQLSSHSGLTNLFRHFVYWRFDSVIAITQRGKSNFRRFSCRVKYIPNPIEVETCFKSMIKPKPRCVVVSRLSKEKGVDRIIAALSCLASCSQLNWECKIYGDGPEREVLENQIADANLQKIITFALPTTTLSDIYTPGSILLVGSREESFGLVILEAFSRGIPVVAYNDGEGPRELVRDKINGFLVKSNDRNSFSNSVLNLLTDDVLYHRLQQGAFSSAEPFSSELVAAAWMEILDDH